MARWRSPTPISRFGSEKLPVWAIGFAKAIERDADLAGHAGQRRTDAVADRQRRADPRRRLDPANECRCHRRVGAAIARGRVDPSELLFATRVGALKREMETFTDAGAIFRSHPELRADARVVDAVLRAIA